jgi:hypothetical protein
VIRRSSTKAQAAQHANDERHAETILAAVVETRQAVTDLDARLDRIESTLRPSGS